ncbi:MAG: PilZ domain-containing protein [Deltaproteobacteria bacterium]|jgi:hypothetical protein|nr:PilZ domain-containing protein [Deltaproteobacteria bacterium]MBW2537232.1 PilZ domain-containing protein [Deltaproteobacteria bacterium]
MATPKYTDPKHDRRTAARHLACFPAYVGTEEEGQNIALIRDVSVNGALLLTRDQLDVGDKIELSMYVSGDAKAPAHETAAEVVRVEERRPEQADVWPYSAAVKFDKELKDLEAEFKDLEEHQKKLGLHRE